MSTTPAAEAVGSFHTYHKPWEPDTRLNHRVAWRGVPYPTAFALPRRTDLPVITFSCAWFDERDNFEFHPLLGVSLRTEKA